MIELFYDNDPSIERFGHYLIWRNGIPIARTLGGANSYFDGTVEPGTHYEYFLTADYLIDGSLDPSGLRYWPLLQRQSPAIVLTTSGSKPSDEVPDIPTTDPGGEAPAVPTNIRLEIYGATLAELFWDNAEDVASTEIYRDGVLIGTSQGNSFFDGTRQAETPHRYELVAVDAAGNRSAFTGFGVTEEYRLDFNGYLGDGGIALSGNHAAVTVRGDFGTHLQHIVERTELGEWNTVQTLSTDYVSMGGCSRD